MMNEDLGTPTRETESLRIWAKDKDKDKEELKKLDDEKGFEIDIGEENKLKCLGFTECKDKDDKILFAYKFKHESKFILYYNPNKDEKFLNVLKAVALVSGYNLQDLEENIKSIKQEVKTMNKEKEKKGRDKNKNENNK